MSFTRINVVVHMLADHLGWHALRYSEGRGHGAIIPTSLGVPQGVPPRDRRAAAKHVLICLTLLATASGTPAQGVNRQLAEGTHLFRRILHDMDLKSVPVPGMRGLDALERQSIRTQALQNLRQQPQGKILIVLGETDFLSPALLHEFLVNGGALLLATDHRAFEPIRRPFGVSITGAAVRVSDSSPSAYLAQGDCIYVEPVDEAAGLLEDLPHLATNRPSYLEIARSSPLKLLAQFPEGTYIDGSRSRKRLAFAAGGDLDEGRVLLLSDHSVFINAMLWQNDNDNAFFAENSARWLADGKRTEVLFIEDGEVQTQFNIPLKPPALPPLDSVVAAIDQGLSTLEEEDRFNRLARGIFEDFEADKVLRGLIIVLTLGAGFYGLGMLSQARHRFETEVPLLERAALGSVSPLGLYEQRVRALLRQGNFLEAARGIIRAEFDRILGPGMASKRIPTVLSSGGWWARRRRRQQVRRLWRVAYGANPGIVSAKRLAGLEVEIAQLRRNLV